MRKCEIARVKHRANNCGWKRKICRRDRMDGRADWLEPFPNWILTARNAGEIAVKGSLQEKKVLAQIVFGSNLVLDCKKVRGSCVKPWSYLLDNSSSRMVERAMGIEPTCEAWKASVLPLNYARLRCASARQARKTRSAHILTCIVALSIQASARHRPRPRSRPRFHFDSDSENEDEDEKDWVVLALSIPLV